MPIEAIILLFFVVILAPVISVVAYCGIRGSCGQTEEEKQTTEENL